MHYTEAQKNKLYNAILPHVFVEGGALIVSKYGTIKSDLKAFDKDDLIVPIELLAPRNAQALEQWLSDYIDNSPDPIVYLANQSTLWGKSGQAGHIASLTAKLQKEAQKLAQKCGHPKTPFQQTGAMQKRVQHTASLLARSCPEEGELLYYQHLNAPYDWPVLLLNDPIPTRALKGGNTSGQMRSEDHAILICKSDYRYKNFKTVRLEDRIAYEEVIHFADYVLGSHYIPTTKHIYLSQSLLNGNRIRAVLDSKNIADPPLGTNPSFDQAWTKKQRRMYRKALNETEAAIPDAGDRDPWKHGRQKGKFAAAMHLFDTVERETQLSDYAAAKREFSKRGDTASVSTEIMTKTYASILSCRDHMRQTEDGCDLNLDAFIKCVRYSYPKQGKAVFLYCHTRDEYLNSLRALHPDDAIAPPEPQPEHLSRNWKNTIKSINGTNGRAV